MAGYHSFELCFLAAVYTNLLINKQPMDFFFSPESGAWPDNCLRIAPDILPKGSIELAQVWMNGQPYYKFDREALTVTLPVDIDEMKIRCRVVPSGTDFDIDLIAFENGIATLALAGNLVTNQLRNLRVQLERLSGVTGLVLDMANLRSIDDGALNYLVFSKQYYPDNYTISLRNLPPHLKIILEEGELLEEFVLV
jgi:anti-anti-sigma regulatory factor